MSDIMETSTLSDIGGYVELAAPSFLDNNWLELTFDLSTGHQTLTDLVVPETGSGYAFRDANALGSATHNRFIYWRATNDILELVELSPEVELEANQVRIRFTNSPIINTVSVIEFPDFIVLVIATVTSAHRIHLPHPNITNRSVLHELTNEVLFNPANYHILNISNDQQPLCASSWHEEGTTYCALALPDSSLMIVQFGRHNVTTYDIKQVGVLSRLWSRMPNLLNKNPNECENAVIISTPFHHKETHDVLLFTLCRDFKIRIFSTKNRCAHTYNVIRHQDFTQSFANNTITITEPPMMKVLGSRIIIYLTGKEEFVILSYSYVDGQHVLKEGHVVPAPTWVKLVDFSISDNRIWALANMRETDSALCYLDLKNLDDPDNTGDEFEGVWEYTNLVDDLLNQNVSNFVAEIFWRNRFSIPTIRKALAAFATVGKKDSKIGKAIDLNSCTTLESLQEFAFTRVVNDESSNQDKAWSRFYDYCLQNHNAANKNIGLIVSPNEAVVSIVKRSSPSFISPLLMSPHDRPYRGIEFSPIIEEFMKTLDYISTDVMTDEISALLEEKLFECPAQITQNISAMVDVLIESERIDDSKMTIDNEDSPLEAIDYICDQLDLTSQATVFKERILEGIQIKLRSQHNPLGSTTGIIITFEMFRRLVQARMLLARDMLIYAYLLEKIPHESVGRLCVEFASNKRLQKITNLYRSYAILGWIAESHVKLSRGPGNLEVIETLSKNFKFFKPAQIYGNAIQVSSSLDETINSNLLMSFLYKGGVSYSRYMELQETQTLSNSFYVTEVTLNLCKLLWPPGDHTCFPEFLLVHHLDEQLSKYLDLTEDWLYVGDIDRQFFRAANCFLQNRATTSVDILNKMLYSVRPDTMIGNFIGVTSDEVAGGIKPLLIHKYYDKLIQLYQIYDNYQCLIMLINHCLSLLDPDADQDQRNWANCFRAKLFQYYLEVEDSDEAYHTMVLTTDQALRFNCLRKFVVHHCEEEQWNKLLTYPYIDIRDDFIDILNQKADSSDLSKISEESFYNTTYYDLLFSNYIADEDYRKAAEIMYNHAQRLAHEVPGILSIRKQVDCLLIALNTLRCVNVQEAVIDAGSVQSKEEIRPSALKRAHDESNSSSCLQRPSISFAKISTDDIKMKYELTRARLRLLEKDQIANAIALSPLKPEETITQLVASSMYATAMYLALLFRCPMDSILEGLTAKYISILQLTSLDIAVPQDLEREVSDIFSDSYGNIETYNYIANSTCTLVNKLWRMVTYYLENYDGVNHKYRLDKSTNGSQTVLMKVVAEKLLSAGREVPASLRRMYFHRNPAELLRLFIKYNYLVDAANLAEEMIERVIEPSNTVTFTSQPSPCGPPPVYLPTHLILLLMEYLNEDATNTPHIKIAEALDDKLKKFRRFVAN